MGLNISNIISKNKVISKADSIVDKWLGKDTRTTYDKAPIYSVPSGITDKVDSTYMIIYIYDNNANDLSFLPMEAEQASSNIWKSLKSCVKLKFSDEWKKGLKDYGKTVLSDLKNLIKANFSINLDGWNETVLGKAYRDVKDSIKWTSDWIENNVSLSSLLDNINIGSWLSGTGLTSPVELSIDTDKLNGIVQDKVKGYAEELAKKNKLANRLYNKYFDGSINETIDPAEDGFKIKASIAFPLPLDNIRYSQNVEISQTSTETAAIAEHVIRSGRVKYAEGRDKGKNKLVSAMSALYAGGTALGNDLGAAGKETLYKMFFGDGGTALFQSKNSRVRDPLYVYMYKAPTSREFSFKFAFTPTTKAELYQIWNAIKMIRFYGTMQKSTGTAAVKYYSLPGRFKIVYYTGVDENIWFGKTKMMGLTNITTNIPLEDFSLISNDFDDTGNPPRLIEVTMEFKELSTLTREDVNGGF